MRSLVTSIVTMAFLVAASSLAATKPGCAGSIVNVCGKFAFWVPDDWKPTKDSQSADRTTYESPDGDISLVVGPIAEKDADLSDEEVTDFADEELDDMKVADDKFDAIDKLKIRLVEGTGNDEGDPVVFKMLAVGPEANEPVLAILAYGSAAHMGHPDTQATLDKILRSLRPQN